MRKITYYNETNNMVKSCIKKEVIMRKKVFYIVLTIIVFQLSSLANLSKNIRVEDVIKKCAEAMGGIEKINSIKSIRLSVKYQGHKHVNFYDIKRPNFYKTTSDNNSNSMIFDGKRACFFKSKNEKSIKEMIKKKEMSDFVAEPGFFTFYFFDFPTKYIGTKNINNQKTYHLSVEMPFQVLMHYYIDCNTNLLKRTVADVIMNGNKIKWIRDYTNYKNVDGILYPHAFTWYHDISEKTKIPKTAVIKKVEFNVNFKNNHFTILEDSNRIAVEKFFGKEKKTGFKLSPNGSYISFLEHSGLSKSIIIQDIREKEQFQSIYETKDNIYKYYWVNNTQLVFSKAPEGSREYKIYSIDINSKKVICLTNFTKTRSKIIFINSKKKNEIMVSTNKSEVYRININTGNKQLVYKGSEKSPRIYSFHIDNSGNLKLARTYSSLMIYNSQKNNFENLITLKLQERFMPKFFSEDNEYVFAYSSVGRDKVAIVKYNLKNKKEVKVLLKDPNYDLFSYEERNDSIFPTSNFYYSSVKKKLLYAYFCADKFKKHFFDSDFKSISEKIKNKIGDYPFSVESFSKNFEQFIIKVFSDKIKGSFYLVDRNTGSIKPIHKHSSWISKNELAQTKPFSYSARDGLNIHGYLTKPNLVEAKKLPLFVSVHGGPTLRDTPGYNDITQLFASEGYLVFQVNYRGSQGYGQDFTKAGYKHWGRKINDDVIDGINWLIKRGMVDKSKVAIYGFSSGGHVAISAIVNNPNLFACSISISGNVNLISSFKLFSQGFRFKWGDPDKDRDILTENSPIYHIEKIKTPLMMVNGKKDTSIPILEVDDFVKKLKKRGNEVEYLRFENDGHVMIYNNEIKKDVFKKILDFLEKHMTN